jgi:hypothetical protein
MNSNTILVDGLAGTTGLSSSNSNEERSIRTQRELTALQEATNIEGGSSASKETDKPAVSSSGKKRPVPTLDARSSSAKKARISQEEHLNAFCIKNQYAEQSWQTLHEQHICNTQFWKEFAYYLVYEATVKTGATKGQPYANESIMVTLTHCLAAVRDKYPQNKTISEADFNKNRYGLNYITLIFNSLLATYSAHLTSFLN